MRHDLTFQIKRTPDGDEIIATGRAAEIIRGVIGAPTEIRGSTTTGDVQFHAWIYGPAAGGEFRRDFETITDLPFESVRTGFAIALRFRLSPPAPDAILPAAGDGMSLDLGECLVGVARNKAANLGAVVDLVARPTTPNGRRFYVVEEDRAVGIIERVGTGVVVLPIDLPANLLPERRPTADDRVKVRVRFSPSGLGLTDEIRMFGGQVVARRMSNGRVATPSGEIVEGTFGTAVRGPGKPNRIVGVNPSDEVVIEVETTRLGAALEGAIRRVAIVADTRGRE